MDNGDRPRPALGGTNAPLHGEVALGATWVRRVTEGQVRDRAKAEGWGLLEDLLFGTEYSVVERVCGRLVKGLRPATVARESARSGKS
jgi:hypothetical protein